MLKRFAAMLGIVPLIAMGIYAQGLDTKASKDDWEEINYEFNSSVLVDGFPSLLRLAELLQKHPGYKVKLEGHTDRIGGDQFNDKLGMARANTVRDFLVKYGARSSQFEVSTRGKVDPKYPGQKPTYTKTDEARWMNRRVVVTVMDDQGRTVSAAGIGDAIRSMEAPKTAGMTDCCSEVLKRLDRLDDIARALKDLADQNAALRRDLDAMKQAQQVADSRANQPGQKQPPVEDVGGAVAKVLDQRHEPKFQVLGANIGADSNGNLTFTGKGRFFGPFADHYAFQAQSEYMYYRTQKEGQFDVGLVDRIGRFQAGLFASFKHVSLSDYQRGGTLGQASLTLDYIFKWGKLGLFGTKGFLDNQLINSTPLTLANGMVTYDVLTQSYLRVVDQVGAAATVGLWKNNYLEGNLGFVHSYMYGNRAGGTLRFIFPLNDKIAVTVEGGLNETLIGAGNNGRAVVGVQFGNAMRPKDFLDSTHAIPVDVPRVRYEVVTRTVRVGHTPPVADAGPDQIGVPAGTITLNGSASYSPDGLPINYAWIQDGGQIVALTNPTGAITTFSAAAGQTYIFRLVVTDSLGGTGQARVRITTTAVRNALIGFFNANPSTIAPGQSSTLSWSTQNATTVTLSGVGNVPAQGSSTVSPSVTTTYTLTASNATSTVTLQAVVVVSSPGTKLLFCYASPTNIMPGESTTLFYQSQNATSVTINGAAAALGGSLVETPSQSTNYTIMANGPGGASDTCSVAVTVTTGQKPRIIRFSAIPTSIAAGQTSTLLWVVDNATSVSIDQGVGTVPVDGTQDVTPNATTTYTLTATNASGSVTAQATVTVGTGPKITSFTATPNPSPKAGSPVVLTCSATNATSINVAGTLGGPATASTTVTPQQTTSYTCIATGQGGQTDQQSLTVGVTSGGNGGPTVVVAGGLNLNTIFRVLTVDASGSFSPQGNNPLTFKWVSVNDRALVIGANTAKPQIQLGFFADVYLFNLTVTDSKGNSTTVVVAITLTV